MSKLEKTKDTSLGRRIIERLKSKRENLSRSKEEPLPLQADSEPLGQATNGLIIMIEPDSEKLSSQSLLKRTELNGVAFLIGRRGSIGDNYYGRKPDFLISENEPYTVSRHHCSIKRTDKGALIQDLNSKMGILVNGVRYGGRMAAEDAIELGLGEHRLVLGPRNGIARFKLTISGS